MLLLCPFATEFSVEYLYQWYQTSWDLHADLGHKFNHFHSIPHPVLIPCIEMTVLL